MVPSIDLFDDAIGISGPDEGLGFAVVPAEVAATGERGEESLYRIRLGAAGGCKMRLSARAASE
jgi:hypothetical protein